MSVVFPIHRKHTSGYYEQVMYEGSYKGKPKGWTLGFAPVKCDSITINKTRR